MSASVSIAERVSKLLLKTHDNFLKVGAHFAGKGDMEMLAEILRQRPEWIHTRGSHGRSMLWEAVNHNRLEMLRYLIEQGADIHAPGCHFSEHLVEISPYCLALSQKHTEIADYLKSKGASYDIFTAAYLGDLVTVKSLCKEYPDLPHQAYLASNDPIRCHIMHYAVAGGNTEIVRLLAEQGAEIEAHSYWLLCFAFWDDAWDIVEILVAYGADPSVWVVSSVLPPEVNQRLLLWGFTIDLNHPNKMGWPPLVYACRGDNGEHPEEVIELLEAGADIHACNRHGRTALHTAAKAGFTRVIAVLLEKGAKVDQVDEKGNTALFAAITSGIKKVEKLGECIALLLENGANPNHINKQGKSIPQLLSKTKHEDYFRTILAKYTSPPTG